MLKCGWGFTAPRERSWEAYWGSEASRFTAMRSQLLETDVVFKCIHGLNGVPSSRASDTLACGCTVGPVCAPAGGGCDGALLVRGAVVVDVEGLDG